MANPLSQSFAFIRTSNEVSPYTKPTTASNVDLNKTPPNNTPVIPDDKLEPFTDKPLTTVSNVNPTNPSNDITLSQVNINSINEQIIYKQNELINEYKELITVLYKQIEILRDIMSRSAPISH